MNRRVEVRHIRATEGREWGFESLRIDSVRFPFSVINFVAQTFTLYWLSQSCSISLRPLLSGFAMDERELSLQFESIVPCSSFRS